MVRRGGVLLLLLLRRRLGSIRLLLLRLTGVAGDTRRSTIELLRRNAHTREGYSTCHWARRSPPTVRRRRRAVELIERRHDGIVVRSFIAHL